MRPFLLLFVPALCEGVDVDKYPAFWPLPRSFSNGSTTLSVSRASLAFSTTSQSALLSKAWNRTLDAMFPWPMSEGRGAEGGNALVNVRVAVESDDEELQLGVDESYTLSIDKDGDAWACDIKAPAVWGAMHGLTTLSQLVEREGEGTATPDNNRYRLRAAPWKVTDSPVLPHRGLMIDTSRHFLPVDAILRQVEALSMNKMNVLHWHATDAESMPVASKAYPELATKGAFAPEAVYSPQDIRKIVSFARERGVRVIAEFDMPGHNYAYSLALPELFVNCSDLYPVDVNYWRASFDPTNEAVYAFLETFLGEMAGLFPDRVLHLGGDEVQYSCWNESERIRDWERQTGKNLTQLYGVFEQRAHAIAARLNRTVQAWDEVYTSARGVLPPDAIVQVWRGIDTLTSAIQDGFRTVLSAPYYLNGGFDMGSGQVQWTDIYDDDPMPLGLTPAEQKRMLGAEACIWAEEVNKNNIDQRVWFRASVLAERLWSIKGNYTGRRTDGVLIRSIKQGCRMMRAGIAATPIDDRDWFPRRNLWAHCEIGLPPSANKRFDARDDL